MSQEIQINIDAICVLRFDDNQKQIIVDYEPIFKSLDLEFERIRKLFGFDMYSAKSILTAIKSNFKLKQLLRTFNYCKHLSSPYQGIYLSEEQIFRMYPSDFDGKSDTKELLQQKEKELLLDDLNDRLKAYYLDETYVICEKKRLEKKVLAYSHRKVGWSTPRYPLNENFSVEIKTNFGYGRVSYFHTIINYKGLDIIPFSNWVVYEKANLFEIIRYSSSHLLLNESWKDAMVYLKDACNLSIEDESLFIKKHVFDECELMINRLEGFLKNNKFKFLNQARIYTDSHKEGHGLIEFRGEKISGALQFIEKIVQFTSIIEMADFVERIKACNSKVYPMLVKENVLIEKELIDFNYTLSLIEREYAKLILRNNEYEILKRNLKLKMISNKEISLNNFDNEEFEKIFDNQNQEYVEFKNLFLIKKNE